MAGFQPHRHRRLAVVLRIDAAKNLDARDDIQATIEPPAIRHGINVPADEQGSFRFTVQGCPKIPRCIAMDFDRERFEFFLKPLARLDPRWGEGDSLRAVLIAGQRAKLFEFGDCAGGL